VARPASHASEAGKRANLRLLQGDRSRKEILDAASRLAAQTSYAATSISDISKACGLPASSIYWHFGSKQGLFAAVLEQGAQGWEAQLGAALAAVRGGQGYLRRWLLACAKTMQEQPNVLRLLLLLPLEQQETDPVVAEVARRVRQGAIGMTQTAIDKAFKPPLAPHRRDDLSELIVSYMHGAFLAHLIDPRSNDLERLFELLHDQIMILAGAAAERG
jgi:AcrR family transcriptional regulator